MTRIGRRTATLVASFAVLLLIWHLAALALQSRALPEPAVVFSTLISGLLSGEIVYHVAVTLGRVAVSFFLALVIGTAIGVALGLMKRADRFFDPWLILFLNIPALVTIILCYIWFGLTEVAVIIAVSVNKIPNVAVTMREGARALEPAYFDLARAYRFDRVKTLRHVILPQLAPFLAASARSGLALIWKIVLVVELLGRSNGVGFQLHTFFGLFDVPAILAYTIAFVIVIQALELGVLQPWERRAGRWRT
ncbi:MAG: ABC transporter permease [Hyphomicrobiales bacterium]